MATLKAAHLRFLRDSDWKPPSNLSTIAVSSWTVRIPGVSWRRLMAYQNLDPAMLYSFCYTLAISEVVGLDSLKDRNQVFQILFDSCNFLRSPINGLPEPVEPNA
jgi:hypothetical protein